MPDRFVGLQEEQKGLSFCDKIRNLRMPWHILFLSGLDKLFVFVVAWTFGGLAYDRKYFRGKHFRHIWSSGWRWVFNGMFSKLFTGAGRGIPWPISSRCSCGKNVDFHVDDLNNFQGNANFQTLGCGRISLGNGTWIAQGCALITTNHDLLNPDIHSAPIDISIGEHCWLGTNVIILPGVTLGPHTVVGANAVVTKSFPEGWCVLAGIPAKKIKNLKVVSADQKQ